MTAPTERRPQGTDLPGHRDDAPYGAAPPGRDAFRCQATTSGSTMRLAVVGTVDFESKETFLDTVAVHLHQARHRVSALHLDMAGLAHCDSSALAALITVHRWVTAAGLRLRLDNQPPFLQQMLTLTGLAGFLGTAGANSTVTA